MNEKKVYEKIIYKIKKDILKLNRWNTMFIILLFACCLGSIFKESYVYTGLIAIVSLILGKSFSTVNKREEMIYKLEERILLLETKGEIESVVIKRNT